MPSRPSITQRVKQELLIESGHRCAVCGVPCPLERAHIVPWSTSKNNKIENLICLCANCHERADKEGWGEKILREYKQRPWVTRQNNVSPGVVHTSRVLIVIEKDITEFDTHTEEILRHALASFLNVNPGAVKIISKARGSTQVVIELPSEAAERLIQSYREGDTRLDQYLALYPIREVRPEPKPRSHRFALIKSPAPSTAMAGVDAGHQAELSTQESLAIPEIAEIYEERFGYLLKRYEKGIAAYYAKEGFTDEEVSELTQATFVAAYKSLGAFRSEGNFQLWLFQIASGISRNVLRAKAAIKRQELPEHLPLPKFDAPFSDLSPLDSALQHERVMLLRKAIEELPTRMRQIVILRVAQDLSYQEIADLMKISIGTVKSQLYSARHMLRNRLSDYFKDIEF